MRVTFFGAVDTVTGSRYLVEAAGGRYLIDCGLYQGYKVLRDRNWSPFPVPPESIDAVLLTHAHLDHCGYLPALVRDGFRGPIYATAGTTALAGLILPDSAHLLEEEADFARRHHSSKHAVPRPLYTVDDAAAALKRFVPVDFDSPVEVGADVSATFRRAGHILGAAGVHLAAEGESIRFTGDLGRPNDPLMKPPAPLEAVDVLVAESTYGDRTHSTVDPERQLGDILRAVIARNGVVLIPAFAVGRTETILLHLSRLRRAGAIPDVPVYVNSPMAVSAASIYRSEPQEHRLDPAEVEEMYSLPTFVRTVEESKRLNERHGPMIIISASGMITGGRILHHLIAFGADPRNAIVLTGFQSGGTRGAALRDGQRTVRIFGREVEIRAEVFDLETLSAHADADELMEWMRAAPKAPAMTFLTHGEPAAADTLRQRVEHELGWPARVPEFRETFDTAHVGDPAEDRVHRLFPAPGGSSPHRGSVPSAVGS